VSSTDPTEIRQWSDQLSAAWERHRDRLFESQRHVSEWLVDQVDPRPGQTVLELAAGPGETGFLAAERLGPTGKLISTDVGAGMVGAAQRGVDARRLVNVECRLMDGQEIDLAEDSVDGVLCRFGLMLMPEPDRALTGARRVLRPGGRLAYAAWGPPDRNPWMTLLVGAVLQNGHHPSGDPFGPGGPFSLADPERNRELLGRAGFDDIEIEELPGSMFFTDVEDYWTLQTEVSGPIALLISSLPPADATAIRDTLVPMVDAFRSANGFEVPTFAIGVSAG
jgi:ubiquinone/menaquinone biosynthesis C-methylase UbiE